MQRWRAKLWKKRQAQSPTTLFHEASFLLHLQVPRQALLVHKRSRNSIVLSCRVTIIDAPMNGSGPFASSGTFT